MSSQIQSDFMIQIHDHKATATSPHHYSFHTYNH